MHGTANASLIVGYGYTGVLARFSRTPASAGYLARSRSCSAASARAAAFCSAREHFLPDAAVNVASGILFCS